MISRHGSVDGEFLELILHSAGVLVHSDVMGKGFLFARYHELKYYLGGHILIALQTTLFPFLIVLSTVCCDQKLTYSMHFLFLVRLWVVGLTDNTSETQDYIERENPLRQHSMICRNTEPLYVLPWGSLCYGF